MADVEFVEDSVGPVQAPGSGRDEKDFFDKHRADHERTMRKLELGWIGRPFGGGAEKAGNIAIVAILSCLIIAIIAVSKVDIVKDSEVATKFLGPFLSVVTLALGYIFGASKSRN